MLKDAKFSQRLLEAYHIPCPVVNKKKHLFKVTQEYERGDQLRNKPLNAITAPPLLLNASKNTLDHICLFPYIRFNRYTASGTDSAAANILLL